MTRNYTEVRKYLLSPVNMRKLLPMIETARSETWRNGWSTEQLVKKRKYIGQKLQERVERIQEEIDKIEDGRLRVFLTLHYVQYKDIQEIQDETGWNDKFVRSIHNRALMNLEIILIEDGILSFVDPKSDMMRDYEDGHSDGYSEGKKAGYSEGHEAGYREGVDDGRMEGFNLGYRTGYDNQSKGLPIYCLTELEDDDYESEDYDFGYDDEYDDEYEYDEDYDDDY